MTMGTKLYIFCQGYRRKRTGMMRKKGREKERSRLYMIARQLCKIRRKHTALPHGEGGISIGFYHSWFFIPHCVAPGSPENSNFLPKQKFKKFGADKRTVLCYTIITDIISILFLQGGVFL